MPTVLITGANRGIGLELTKQFLTRGDHVIATCRQLQTSHELGQLQQRNRRLKIHTLDVLCDASIQALTAQLKGTPIDILVNNAGVYGPRDASFQHLQAQDWLQVLCVNAVAPLLLTQGLMDNLNQGQEKKLIYVTSKMGSIVDNHKGGQYIYRSSKAALNAAVKSLSIDLKAAGFLIALVHPGWVRTDMGGPDALIETHTSVAGMMSVIRQLNAANSGSFFNYDGTLIPW